MTEIQVDAPITRDQQQLMAYVDDEMTPQQRTAFELRLAESSELAAEFANLQCLTDFTKSMRLAEPTDHEMQRFWESFYNRSEWQFGWILLVAGLAVLGSYSLFLLLASEVHLIIKIATVSALIGAATLLWNTVRLKLRTAKFDRYRGVVR